MDTDVHVTRRFPVNRIGIHGDTRQIVLIDISRWSLCVTHIVNNSVKVENFLVNLTRIHVFSLKRRERDRILTTGLPKYRAHNQCFLMNDCIGTTFDGGDPLLPWYLMFKFTEARRGNIAAWPKTHPTNVRKRKEKRLKIKDVICLFTTLYREPIYRLIPVYGGIKHYLQAQGPFLSTSLTCGHDIPST
jgi:hypothetical protein